MLPEKITFETLPLAVMHILSELDGLKSLITSFAKPDRVERTPIGIDDAARIIKKSRSTVYKLVNKKKIPYYKAGKQLYFFEDELIAWIVEGKSQTSMATLAGITEQMGTHRRNRK